MRSIICFFGIALACGAAAAASAQMGTSRPQTNTPRYAAIHGSYLKAMCRVPTDAEVIFWQSQNVTPISSKDEAPYIAAHRNYMRDNPSVKAEVVKYSFALASRSYSPTGADMEEWGQRLVNGPQTCPEAVAAHKQDLGIRTPVPYEKPIFKPKQDLNCNPEVYNANGGKCVR